MVPCGNRPQKVWAPTINLWFIQSPVAYDWRATFCLTKGHALGEPHRAREAVWFHVSLWKAKRTVWEEAIAYPRLQFSRFAMWEDTKVVVFARILWKKWSLVKRHLTAIVHRIIKYILKTYFVPGRHTHTCLLHSLPKRQHQESESAEGCVGMT